MLIKYEDVANIFNENIHKSHFWAFSWMSHNFWTWSNPFVKTPILQKNQVQKCFTPLHYLPKYPAKDILRTYNICVALWNSFKKFEPSVVWESGNQGPNLCKVNKTVESCLLIFSCCLDHWLVVIWGNFVVFLGSQRRIPDVVNSSVIRQKGEGKTGVVCITGGKKCSFFGRFGLLCVLETPVLRFAFLPYYQGIIFDGSFCENSG